MNLFDKIAFWFSPTSAVSTLVRSWSPNSCRTEKECEDSLYDHLRKHLDEVQIIQQYGRAKSFLDIMVADRVMIELKYDLTTTSEYHRLIGQLMGYKEWGRDMLIVLVGNTKPALLRNLREFIDRELTGPTFFDDTVEIVEK